MLQVILLCFMWSILGLHVLGSALIFYGLGILDLKNYIYNLEC